MGALMRPLPMVVAARNDHIGICHPDQTRMSEGERESQGEKQRERESERESGRSRRNRLSGDMDRSWSLQWNGLGDTANSL